MQHVVNPAPVERASDCSGVTDIWKDRIIQRNSTFTCTLRMQLQPQLPWESNLTSLKLSTMWLRLLFTLWLVNTWFPLMRQSNSSHQVYIECFKLKTYWILIKKKYRFAKLMFWIFRKPALFTSLFTSTRNLFLPCSLLAVCYISWRVLTCYRSQVISGTAWNRQQEPVLGRLLACSCKTGTQS